MAEHYTLVLPLEVPLNKKGTRKFILNLNQYRNAHFHTTNPAKVEFKRQMQSQLARLPVFSEIELEYRIFHKNKGRFDLANPGAILDKFFCDALVEAGKLPDDCYDHLQRVTFVFGGVDPINPRAEVTILPLSPVKEDNMKIILQASELNDAVRQYIENNFPIGDDKEVIIGAVTGTTPEDLEVEVQIVKEGELPFTPDNTGKVNEKATPAKGTRKPRAPKEPAPTSGAPTETAPKPPVTPAPVPSQPAPQQTAVATPKPQTPAPVVAGGDESLFGNPTPSAPAAQQIGGTIPPVNPADATDSIFGGAPGAAAETGNATNAATGEVALPPAGESLFDHLAPVSNG